MAYLPATKRPNLTVLTRLLARRAAHAAARPDTCDPAPLLAVADAAGVTRGLDTVLFGADPDRRVGSAGS